MADYVKFKEDEDEKPKVKTKRRSKFSLKNFLIIVLLIFLLTSIVSSLIFSYSAKIGVVPIKGVISTQKTTSVFDSTISSREIANTLRELKDDTSVKAVLLDINSPGGSAVASEEISKAINELSEVKPVYALINDVGASGAFWIAVSANKTYASSMSILGSIGVTSTSLGFEDFIKDYNISYRRLVAGEHKDMGTPFRNLTQEEINILENILDEIHVNFINHIATQRNMSFDEVEKHATGEIFLGTKAREIGFIDEIGYYPQVIEELLNITNKNAIIVNYGPKPSFIETIGLNSILKNPIQNQILLQ